MSQMDNTAEQRLVDQFNTKNPVGTKVQYWKGIREGDGKVSVTRTPAQVLSGHTAVVWVEDEGGCIALSHVDPVDGEDNEPLQQVQYWRKASQQSFAEMSGLRWNMENDTYALSDSFRISGSLITDMPYVVSSLEDERIAWLPRDVLVALYEAWNPANSTEELGELMSQWGTSNFQDLSQAIGISE